MGLKMEYAKAIHGSRNPILLLVAIVLASRAFRGYDIIDEIFYLEDGIIALEIRNRSGGSYKAGGSPTYMYHFTRTPVEPRFLTKSSKGS